ncbi:hypothetical protein N008_10265 [Hymenobacter sp. APR13]|nr:hypothetical protein N008_10265 [Hymenobacter sp. APR13]
MNDTTTLARQIVAAAHATPYKSFCKEMKADGHPLVWFILSQTDIRPNAPSQP